MGTLTLAAESLKSRSQLHSASNWRHADQITRADTTARNMTLDQDFDAAAEAVKALTKRPTDDELLELYALFKQGSIGDVNTDRPGVFDLKGKAKWDRWNSKKGTSKDDAKKAYIEYANQLIAKYK